MFRCSPPATPQQVIYRAKKCAVDFNNACKSHITIPGGVVNQPNFANPLLDFIVHVDASFLNVHSCVGLGGVARNYRGLWIGGFCKKSFACDATAAELLAIQEGLQMVKNYNGSKGIIYTDCKNAIQLIMCETNSDKYHNVLLNCRGLLLDLHDVKLEFCERKYNHVADGIAKICRTSDMACNVARVFPTPPNYCRTQLIEDCNELF